MTTRKGPRAPTSSHIEDVLEDRAEIERYPSSLDPEVVRAALDDLDRIRAGELPTEAELDGAPVLNAWSWDRSRGFPSLTGMVTGHPKITDGHACVTSAVVAIDDGLGWVRTLNRWYRLGRSLEDSLQ